MPLCRPVAHLASSTSAAASSSAPAKDARAVQMATEHAEAETADMSSSQQPARPAEQLSVEEPSEGRLTMPLRTAVHFETQAAFQIHGNAGSALQGSASLHVYQGVRQIC